MFPICNFFAKRQSIDLRDCVDIPRPLHSSNIKIHNLYIVLFSQILEQSSENKNAENPLFNTPPSTVCSIR